MVRKFSQTLLSLMVLVPTISWGVGLGDIKLNSALNQPLDARIELLSVESDAVDSIHVQLANYETFAQVGIDRHAVLMLLKFDVAKDASGQPYIKVTSSKPIREPFLDFLLEVDWSSGRLLREYTLLLDPPEMMEQAPMGVSAPSTGAAAPAGVTPGQAPARAAPTPVATTPATTTPATAMAPSGGLQYGPTRANDTLWQIAERLRTDPNVSVYQMMMALYNANPDAFINSNINRLKKGRVLRLDDPSQVAAMNKAEATQAFLQQTREWEDYKSRAAQSAQRRPSEEAAVAPSTAAAPREQAKLKLVAPKGKEERAVSGTADGKGAGDVDQQGLMMAMESAEALRHENTELNSRLEKLENQLAAMQRLLVLKEDDLAALQQQLAEQGAEPSLTTEAKPDADLVVKAPMAVVEPKTDATQTPAEPMAEKTPVPVVEAQPAKTPVAAPKPAAQPKPAVVATPKPKPQVAPTPAAEPGILDMLLENILLILGGLFAIVIAVVGSIIYKRKKSGSTGSFHESILTGGASSMMKGSDDEQVASESSFLSDLAISGLESTSEGGSSEVDALTEADVYMAYGRYQQAEELLKDAMEQHPGKMELVSKLLEVYHSTKNADAFAQIATDNQEALQENEGSWNKILVMGHELAPDNTLFAGADAVASEVQTEDASTSSDDDVLDIGLDLDALTAEMESEFGDVEETKGDKGEDDFNIDLGLDFGEQSTESPSSGATAESSDIDLDFGDLELGTEVEEASSEPEQAIAEPEETDLQLGDMEFGGDAELDLSALEMDLGEIEAEEESSVADETSVETEFEGLSMDEPVPDSGGLPSDFDELDLDAALAELDEPVSNLESGEGDMTYGAAAFNLDELGDLDELDGDMTAGQDEVATKLDLARAYVEMGDADGARQMLEEVTKDGNAEQKQQAQQLLSEIS